MTMRSDLAKGASVCYSMNMDALRVEDHIAVDSNICHGQPCFKGTRIMAHLVLELLEAGVSQEKIVSDYYPQLTPRSIQAVLHYAAELIKSEEFVPSSKT